MKYYAEDQMKSLRARFEEQVLGWPRVKAQKMLGCPGYQVSGRLFATLVTGGVVLTRVEEDDWKTLHSQFAVGPFQAGKKVVKHWAQVAIRDETDLERLMPFVRKSYQVVMEEW